MFAGAICAPSQTALHPSSGDPSNCGLQDLGLERSTGRGYDMRPPATLPGRGHHHDNMELIDTASSFASTRNGRSSRRRGGRWVDRRRQRIPKVNQHCVHIQQLRVHNVFGRLDSITNGFALLDELLLHLKQLLADGRQFGLFGDMRTIAKAKWGCCSGKIETRE